MTRELVEPLHILSMTTGKPSTNAEDFVRQIQRMFEMDLKKCVKCELAHARFCAACAAKMKSGEKAERVQVSGHAGVSSFEEAEVTGTRPKVASGGAEGS